MTDIVVPNCSTVTSQATMTKNDMPCYAKNSQLFTMDLINKKVAKVK